jgi:sialate O-acetylesterase
MGEDDLDIDMPDCGWISLTFDDALPQHLDIVIPLLNRYRLRGTFYTHLSAPTMTSRLNDWREAAAAGHELGNHTIFHPGEGRKSWVREGNAIEGYTLDRMALELEVANRWLGAVDGAISRTYAYPCSRTVLGRGGIFTRTLESCGLRQTRWPGLVRRWGVDFGSTEVEYTGLISARFVAARAGGVPNCESRLPPLDQYDRHRLPSLSVTNQTFDELRTFCERAVDAETWAILQFHGVGGGHGQDCDLAVFTKLVNWLAETYADRVGLIRDIALLLQPRADAAEVINRVAAVGSN